jgi:hypothetical protein
MFSVFAGVGNLIAQEYNQDPNLPTGLGYVVQPQRGISTTTFRYVLLGSLAFIVILFWYLKYKK